MPHQTVAPPGSHRSDSATTQRDDPRAPGLHLGIWGLSCPPSGRPAALRDGFRPRHASRSRRVGRSAGSIGAAPTAGNALVLPDDRSLRAGARPSRVVAGSHRGRAVGPDESLISRRSVGPSRVAEQPPGRSPLDVHRPGRGPACGHFSPPRRACRALPEEEFCGSTRPAPAGRSPYRARGTSDGSATATTTASSRCSPAAVREVEAAVQRGAGAAFGAHEVPGRRPAGARGAGPGHGPTQTSSDAQPRRAAQAPRRDRHDPREDRRPRHLAARAPRRGRRRLRRGQVAQARHAAAPPGSSRPRRGRRPPSPSAASADHRAPGRAAVGRLAPAGQPLPRPRLRGRPAEHGRLRAGWPAGSCSARSSGRSSRPAAEPRPAWPCPTPTSLRAPGGLELMPHQAQLVAAAAAGPPDLPARRRAGPGQDGSGAARRAGRERLPAARRRAERRQDQLGPRGRPLDTRPRRPP